MAAKPAALFLLLLVPCAGWAQDWRFYGGNARGTRFSSLQQINRQNVGALKQAWTYHTGEVNRGNDTGRCGWNALSLNAIEPRDRIGCRNGQGNLAVRSASRSLRADIFPAPWD